MYTKPLAYPGLYPFGILNAHQDGVPVIAGHTSRIILSESCIYSLYLNITYQPSSSVLKLVPTQLTYSAKERYCHLQGQKWWWRKLNLDASTYPLPGTGFPLPTLAPTYFCRSVPGPAPCVPPPAFLSLSRVTTQNAKGVKEPLFHLVYEDLPCSLNLPKGALSYLWYFKEELYKNLQLYYDLKNS